MAIKLTPYEKETIIRTSEGDEEFIFETFDPRFMCRLTEMREKYPLHYILKKEMPEGAVRYLVKKGCLSIHFNPPCSEERRRKAREQAKKNGLIGGNPAGKPDAA